MLNRYMLFSGYNYYPSGGLRDYIGSYESMVELIENISGEWFNVFDTVNNSEISNPYEINRGSSSSIFEWADKIDMENNTCRENNT